MECKGFLTFYDYDIDQQERGFLQVRSKPHEETGLKHWVFIEFLWHSHWHQWTEHCSNAMCDYNDKNTQPIPKKKKYAKGIPISFFN